ncbi:MAG: MlaD family protein [Candidatus Binatia bacterium]
MATEAQKFRVGLFVILAVLIGLGTAIWLGASRFLSEEVLAVTYFAESVQGLDPGADVKYRGVPCGRVERIGIAPDRELIEVVMSLQRYSELLLEDPTLRAQLQLSGITGLRYVEIDRRGGDALNKFPALTFTPEYPLIQSTPSQFKAIEEALSDIYEKIVSIDFAGISHDVRATLQAADRVLRDERVEAILANLSRVTDSAARVTQNVEKATEGVRLAPVAAELKQAVAEARAMLNDVRHGPIGQELRGALREIEGLGRTTQSFIVDLRSLVERLNRTADNLQQLTDALGEQPSRLLFSNPPPPRPTPPQ